MPKQNKGGDIMKEYYVYLWFDIDSKEIIYCGQGKGVRYKTKNRNHIFNEYIKTHNCDVKILKDNLTQEESLNLECETVKYYKSQGQCICNIAVDGYRSMPKELNPNYKNGEVLRNKYAMNSELKDKTKHMGTSNGRSRHCKLICPDSNEIIFDTIKDMCVYLIENGYSKSTIPHLQSAVPAWIKNNKKYCGFIFEYLD